MFIIKATWRLFITYLITFVKAPFATNTKVLEHNIFQGLRLHYSTYTNEVNLADVDVCLAIELPQDYS